MEAVGSQACTTADPFNQKGGEHLRTLAKDLSDVHVGHFDHFMKELFLPTEAAKLLLPKIPPGTPLSQIWIAFDQLRGKFMAKVSMLLHAHPEVDAYRHTHEDTCLRHYA